MTPSSALLQIVRGILMGSADIIPGVSGGTVALVLGIYERLVKAISQFDLALLGLLRRRRWAEAAQRSDIAFLGLLFLGIGIGIVGLASLMHFLLHDQEHIQIAAVPRSGNTIELLATTQSGGLRQGNLLHILRPNDSHDYRIVAELRVTTSPEQILPAQNLEPDEGSEQTVNQPSQKVVAELIEGIPLSEIADSDLVVQPSRRRPPTYAFFFGLILASSVLVARMVPKWSAGAMLSLATGVVFAFWLMGRSFLTSPPNHAGYVFLVGVVAICAMILPGISGAFIMLIMGKYDDVTAALRALVHGDITEEGGMVLAAFGLGAVFGIVSFSKILRWLLAHYEGLTLAVLCGFMLGSLRMIWPFKIDSTPQMEDVKKKILLNTWPDLSDQMVWLCVGMTILGIVIVFALDIVSKRIAKAHENKTLSTATLTSSAEPGKS